MSSNRTRYSAFKNVKYTTYLSISQQHAYEQDHSLAAGRKTESSLAPPEAGSGIPSQPQPRSSQPAQSSMAGCMRAAGARKEAIARMY
jgi:hypothetical protein